MSCGSTIGTSTSYIETAPRSFPDRAWSWQVPFSWLARIALAWERRHQHEQLLELDDHLLADIGLSRQQAVEAAQKSFWTYMMWHVYR
jgi:uncharacterized protein YjiS (DUF1127 family)